MQLEPLQGKVDPRRLALTGQKMADSNQITSNPLAQTANPRRALPEGTSGIISFGPYRLLLPAGVNVPAEPSLRPSRELAVSRRVLLLRPTLVPNQPRGNVFQPPA